MATETPTETPPDPAPAPEPEGGATRMHRYNSNGPNVSFPRLTPSDGWNDNGEISPVYNDNGPPNWTWTNPNKPATS